MSDAPIITINKNGPYKVQNVTKVVNSDGTESEAKATMFLCRCGHSANKPFCDGSHTRQGWEE
jgi:CDGSH-type Zn-finger protein